MFSVRACEQARKWKSTSGSQASARDPVLWPSPSGSTALRDHDSRERWHALRYLVAPSLSVSR